MPTTLVCVKAPVPIESKLSNMWPGCYLMGDCLSLRTPGVDGLLQLTRFNCIGIDW